MVVVFTHWIATQILSYRPEPGALLTTLDDDDKTISYFGVGEGGEVRREQHSERDRQ